MKYLQEEVTEFRQMILMMTGQGEKEESRSNVREKAGKKKKDGKRKSVEQKEGKRVSTDCEAVRWSRIT